MVGDEVWDVDYEGAGGEDVDVAVVVGRAFEVWIWVD